MPETLEAALFDSGRPLMIPGVAPVAPDTIAIAWKSTREAARAVAAAMPFLAQAKRVVILTAAEDDRTDRSEAARLLVTLQRHDIAAEARRLQPGSRNAADTLLAAAGEIDAGLLVMGGYGHSRLRELVFGGVTEHVIRGAALPVLMAH
jgi:nucleotide-binding universal stress UspA family protein